MSYSPPKKATVIMSLIILLIGILLGILGFFDVIPRINGNNYNEYFVIAGFILSFLAWLIMYLGVRIRGF
ncbi:MAG: hypothetical protein GF383_05875 [Candidatus Lokiarchaeota archaeon]|nr:hypothetical protein [Candidatus Lokiarchaeota archaeon]MBD3339460.1 hypothetical protein [Candidatus Lokiarchaeota archaeon]